MLEVVPPRPWWFLDTSQKGRTFFNWFFIPGTRFRQYTYGAGQLESLYRSLVFRDLSLETVQVSHHVIDGAPFELLKAELFVQLQILFLVVISLRLLATGWRDSDQQYI